MPRVANPRARLYKRAGLYYVDLRHGGRRKRVATLTSKLGEAEQIAERELAAFRAEVGIGPTAPGPQTVYCVGDAIADFLEQGMSDLAEGTKTMYRSKGGILTQRLGPVDVRALSAEDVRGYIEWRRTEHSTKDHTIYKEIVTLRRTLGHAEQRGLVDGRWRLVVPAKFNTGYDPRDRWLEPEEYLRMLEQLRPQQREVKHGVPDRRLWLTVACYTGGRVSELERIQWSDVDFKRGFVVLRTAKVRHGKPNKPRHIPMAAELRSTLEPASMDGDARRVGPMFPSPWANPALQLTRAARKAGIVGEHETLCDNDLRRTFASWMLQGGATVKQVADLLGHGSTAMVEKVYGHLAEANRIDAVNRLPRFFDAAE